MSYETIVALFDNAHDADAAVRDLQAAGVPSADISRHVDTATTTSTAPAAPREEGFWHKLFGGEPAESHDSTVYDRSLQGGSTVLTVRATTEDVHTIHDIIEQHNPVDIDERASSYGVTSAYNTDYVDHKSDVARAPLAGEGETLSLAEESIAVGKRAINRGTTRVRRYVIETPVEETVNLREETVTIERRPVSAGQNVAGAEFTDKVVEVTETDEEAVVAKTARIREEVVIHKEVHDRTETVKDTVRREDVEITKDGAVERTSGVFGTK